MKKILIIIGCAFLLTGCDVTYNLTINDNNSFDEDITMSFLKSNTNYDDILVYRDNKTPVSKNSSEEKFYDSSVTENGNYYNLNYHYNHDIDGLKDSYFINNCYSNSSIVSTEDEITFSSGQNFSCFIGDDGLKADSVRINITTKLKVLDNNADEVNGNTYTWIISANNYLNKEINLTLKKNREFSLEAIDAEGSASSMTGIIVGIIILVGVLVYLFVRHQLRKNNDF